MTAPLTGKKDLCFLRVGDTSTHASWMGDPATRTYDVWLDYYGDGDYRQWEADPVHLTAGPNTNKFGRIQALLPELTKYESIWFPDDDIVGTPEGVTRMFEIFRRRKMLLAQPSLAEGSYVAHEITRWNGAFEVRFTNFVEAMCPLFSREALEACVSSFPLVYSAFGLDFIWPRMLGDPRDRVGLIDAAPVVHSRAPGARKWTPPPDLDRDGDRDKMLARYGVGWPFKFRTFGGWAVDGAGAEPRFVPPGLDFMARFAKGVSPSVRFHRRYWSRTLKSVWRGR